MKHGEQLPDPDWATDLLAGDRRKADDLQQKMDAVGECFGRDAAEDLQVDALWLLQKAVLRKVEREATAWDGKTRII